VCAGAVSLFLLIELRTTTPLLDLRLYTSLRYISGTLIAAALGVFFYASSFLVVLFAQLVLDFSVQHTALVLIPGSCTMILVALLAGWLVDRSEPRLPMLLGLTFYGVFCYLMVLADRRIGMVFLVWVYIFRGMGLGFLNAPVFAVATSGLNLQRTRAASSLLSLWLVLGGTFGIALLSTMLERWQTVHQTHFAEEQWLTSIGTQHALTAFTQLAATLGAGGGQATLYARSMLQGVLRREALVHAFNDGFALMISITLACIGVVLTMRIARQR
jgi:DHA2 family multidrug resistance protein